MYDFSLRKLKEIVDEIPAEYLDYNLTIRLKGNEGQVIIRSNEIEVISSSIKEIEVVDNEEIPSLANNELLMIILIES